MLIWDRNTLEGQYWAVLSAWHPCRCESTASQGVYLNQTQGSAFVWMLLSLAKDSYFSMLGRGEIYNSDPVQGLRSEKPHFQPWTWSTIHPAWRRLKLRGDLSLLWYCTKFYHITTRVLQQPQRKAKAQSLSLSLTFCELFERSDWSLKRYRCCFLFTDVKSHTRAHTG